MALVAIRCPQSAAPQIQGATAPVIGFAALRGWLHGNWGVLFSHPDDFACHGFEADRWLVHVQDAFTDSGVLPIALAYSEAPGAYSWVTAVGGAHVSMRQRPAQLRARERGLFSVVCAREERFVVIVDESLRPQRTIVYQRGDRMPSPMELARMAVKLRTLAQEQERAQIPAAAGSVVPLRSARA
jgi:hypothetical protein